MPFALAALFSVPILASAQVVVVYQGAEWTPESRETFYTQDQGSRIMPLAWMQALKQSSGEAFLADRLERYGYLPNPLSATPDLPVGFTVANDAGVPSIGMTCSACHTRQIDVNGTDYRIDGGPAIVDFQSFLKDLDDSVRAVRATPRLSPPLPTRCSELTPATQRRKGSRSNSEFGICALAR